MKLDNIKQIITFMRTAEYSYERVHYNDYTRAPLPTYNFLIMCEGEAVFTLNELGENPVVTFKKGDVVFVPKNVTHAVHWMGQAGAPVRFIVLHFDFAPQFDPFHAGQTVIQKLSIGNSDDVLPDFECLQERSIEDYMNLSVFYRIFAKLYPLVQKKEIRDGQALIQPAVEYLEAHCSEKIKLEMLSQLCLLSPSRFQHLFKKIMGVSPIAYKNNILIGRIQQTLIADKTISIQDISDAYNFESTIYFCRLFKSLTGLTPSEYRKLNNLI